MKTVILLLCIIAVSGCVTAPVTKTDRIAQAVRTCKGETANQQGVAISQFTRASSGDYAMHECLYKHGVRD